MPATGVTRMTLRDMDGMEEGLLLSSARTDACLVRHQRHHGGARKSPSQSNSREGLACQRFCAAALQRTHACFGKFTALGPNASPTLSLYLQWRGLSHELAEPNAQLPAGPDAALAREVCQVVGRAAAGAEAHAVDARGGAQGRLAAGGGVEAASRDRAAQHVGVYTTPTRSCRSRSRSSSPRRRRSSSTPSSATKSTRRCCGCATMTM